MIKSTLSLFALLMLFTAHAQPLWMRYPSISPDGKLIAFSYQGDLFTVGTEGGIAQQITSHPSHDFQPIWSNDGKQIAFASDRNGNFDVYTISPKGGIPARITYHSSADFPYDYSADGKSILFGARRLDDVNSVQFPYAGLSELYMVPRDGGRVSQVLTVAAEYAQMNQEGSKILFQNRKGYEDPWRKHHTSSVTRDIILYDTETGSYQNITKDKVEDRNPIWLGDDFFFLSEKSGSFNIWKGNANNAYSEQLTEFTDHPVRFLSASNDGTLCYGFKGEIYTYKNGSSQKIAIDIFKDQVNNAVKVKSIVSAGEFTVSPNKKEVAFIYRGEVFVTSIDYKTTKRITNTPEQERSLTFNEDGSALVYTSERNESWNIYKTEIKRESEKYFYNATLLEETKLVDNGEETFQPIFSPDGKEIAFLENRTTLKVYNVESKKSRVVMDGNLNYSYSDGDQYFTWSPDSKWLLVQYLDADRWTSDVGLVKADGKSEPINLTSSGYSNGSPKFAMDGEMVYYYTNKRAYKSQGGHGSHGNVEAVFLTNEAYQKFILNEEEFAEWEENEKAEEKEEEKEEEDKKDEEKKKQKELKVELDDLDSRRVMLTIHSSSLMDYLVNNEGDQLFYMSAFEKGYNLWTTKFKEKETKLLAKINTYYTSIEFDKDEKNIYLNNQGNISKIDISSGKSEGISISSEMNLNASKEREYMFYHAWRQVREKFYVEDLHGVDWEMYKKEYARYLPHINNGYDFAEMLSELLGELNASHTGARYRKYDPKGTQTASLGCFLDQSYQGDGLKIAEVLRKGPLTKLSREIEKGTLITHIDGTKIEANDNFWPLLNRKAGQKVLIGFQAKSGEKWEEIVKPISGGREYSLLYDRYVAQCERTVDELSGGKLGYVHVKSMSPDGFTRVFDKAKGKYNKKEALVVDTRFNGGGWLHDDLATFLSGQLYMTFEPRGQKNMGGEPMAKWQKPSCVLMSEGNYSDAHLFPYIYKQLGIGKLIGMPVPGTGTAVWWETMIDGQTVFGIPQVGMRSVTEGFLVENHDLIPDIEVDNEYDQFTKGIDQQLAAAVKELSK